MFPFLETCQEWTNELRRNEILETPSKTAFLNGTYFVGIIFSTQKSLNPTECTDEKFHLNCKYTLIID